MGREEQAPRGFPIEMARSWQELVNAYQNRQVQTKCPKARDRAGVKTIFYYSIGWLYMYLSW